MSRKEEPFDNVEVAAIEARMFALLAADSQDQEDPPSAAHHKLFVWRDYQHMCGRAEALTVMSQTLEAALDGRTDEAADRYRNALEWFDRSGGQYDRDLERAVVQVGHRIDAILAEERSPATASDEVAADACPTCHGDAMIASAAWADWHDAYEAARAAALDEHEADFDFDASPEAWVLVAAAPDEPEETACADCAGRGQTSGRTAGADANTHPSYESADPSDNLDGTRGRRRRHSPSSTASDDTPTLVFTEDQTRQIAQDAIGLFLEYRDRHGRDEDTAEAEAMIEIGEALSNLADIPDTDVAALPVADAAELDEDPWAVGDHGQPAGRPHRRDDARAEPTVGGQDSSNSIVTVSEPATEPTPPNPEPSDARVDSAADPGRR